MAVFLLRKTVFPGALDLGMKSLFFKSSKGGVFMKKFVVLFVSIFFAGMVLSANVQAAPLVYKFKCPGFSGKFLGELILDADGKPSEFIPAATSKLATKKKVFQVYLSNLCSITEEIASSTPPVCDVTPQHALVAPHGPVPLEIADNLGGNPATFACIQNPAAFDPPQAIGSLTCVAPEFVQINAAGTALECLP
jgi:hypothetical protein